ncbi:ECF RNA polymerase sigma factor SigK [Arthrobacter sp. MSA 4-2]|uniref:ECF RNA polymerase sigma factor SigK n=1 Tax=Arthrobacter sp. MSA 4-2 TaxID=2794349 RepID=UPI0018E89F53|nr:ECF RNA polymerase sigma factor SigK [Arthrobacter sp. MSA 4-2]MBJ2121429.1 ECF RNA polymerase sigma factor SigK [Arthrobacter sp. MSA 4-2]
MITAQLPVVSASSRSLSAPAVAGEAREVRGVESLLLGVAHGDARAFSELYARSAPRVYDLVRRVVLDEEMSAETVQEVFLGLWQGAAARFDPALGSGMSWIVTLAHRRAVDKVRAEASHRVRDLRWGIRNQDVAYDGVADAVIQQAETEAVRACLGTLSAVQREAIHLAYYAGMTYVQVAAHLGIPVPTAKTRIRDGIGRLRSCLGDQPDR